MSAAQLLIYPQATPLRGVLPVPGDKSISHRTIILAAVAEGVSLIDNWLPAGDTLATLGALRALGVAIEDVPLGPTDWRLTVHGRGLRGLQPPTGALDCRNAGTGLRLLAGLLAGQPFDSVLDGSAQLRRRPMRRITEPLQAMGAQIDSHDGHAPLHIAPGRLTGQTHHLTVASAQVKSAILLAGLYAAGTTSVTEPGPSRDHTERLLQAMGVSLTLAPCRVTLTPPASLAPLKLRVPGDLSSAAFLLTAASLIPGSAVSIPHTGVNPTRTGFLDLLEAMGAPVTQAQPRLSGGEPIADLSLTAASLRSVAAAGDVVVRAIDEFPIWAVAATQAHGISSLRDAAELRVKEVDRISVLAAELRKLGARLDEQPDGFTIYGPTPLTGAEVDGHDDHRLVMALAVAALTASGPTRIHGAACLADSFPGFVESMQALGARLEWVA